MADSLGKAILELAADGTGLTGDLKTAEDKVRSAASVMQSALGAIGIGFSLKAVLDATIEAERESTLLTAAVKATGMAAGFTASQLKGQAMALQASTGVGDEAIMRMQRTLLSFRNVHGEVFQKASQLALDFAAATGTDAADAARKFGMALNDPVNALGRLKQAGVAVTDELRSQVEALIKNGDLVGAQSLLLGALSKSYGGASVAARDTLGGALNALKENFGNLFLEQEGAGKQLRVFIELVNKSLPTVAATFSAVFAGVKVAVEGVVEQLFYMGEGLYKLVTLDIKGAVASFGQVTSSMNLAGETAKATVDGWNSTGDAIASADKKAKDMAASAPVNAGIVKQSAEEMATALNAVGVQEGLAAQADFDLFIKKSQAKTASIIQDAAVEVDATKQKYDQLAADSQAYYDAEALKLENSKLTAVAFGTAMMALEQERGARLDAIRKAQATAQDKQDLAQRQMRLNAAASFFGSMQTLLANSLGEQNALTKANAIVLGTVQAFAAANNALATPLPWPIPQAMAAVALAAGLSNVAKMKALEAGGPMSKGETALVGEAGPELFTAPRAGHIIPNGEFGGSGGTNITNQITVMGVDFSSESTAARILEGIADAAKRGTEAAIPAARAFSDLSLAYSGRVA